MDKNTLIFIILLAFLILLTLPSLLLMLRAKKYNVDLSFGRAIAMKMRKTGSIKMFEVYSGFKKNGMKNITLDDMEALVLAGGNPINCLEGFIYAKEQGLDPTFKEITAIDLSGRNVKDDFKEVNKEFNVKVQSVENEKLTIDYYIQFKYKHANLFQDKDINNLQEKIKQKFETFLKSWNGTDPMETEMLIRENILNLEYFEGNLGITVLKQDYVIRKNIK